VSKFEIHSPCDLNQLAKQIVDIASDKVQDTISSKICHQTNVRGRAGGLKGGPASAGLQRKAAPAVVGLDEIAGHAGEPAGAVHARRVQEYLHPFSEHLIDWFHITMRLTVLQQQTKALKEEWPQTAADVSKRLKNVKHLLWHGTTEKALERLGDLTTY
jgi:hypothetical protein